MGGGTRPALREHSSGRFVIESSNQLAAAKRLLLICSLPPYPARANGFSVRYAPILDAIADEYEVHVVIVADVPILHSELDAVRTVVSRMDYFERKHRRPSIVRRLAGRVRSFFPWVLPYPVLAYDQAEIEAFISNRTEGRSYDVLVLASPRYASVAFRSVRAKRKVLDAIDSVTLLYSRSESSRLTRAFDLRRIQAWERAFARNWDAVTYISEQDVRTIFAECSVPRNVSVLPNGVFVADDRGDRSPDRAATRVAFLGNMGYSPNVSAAHRLIRIMGQVRREVPDAELAIIGRGAEEVFGDFYGAEGIDVRGTVSSIWPELRRCGICCFPMIDGAGQQNKVIEAMWAECAVLTNDIGNAGVGAVDGRDLSLASNDDDFARKLIGLMRNPSTAQALGAAGRQFVEQRYDSARCVQRAKSVILGDAYHHGRYRS